MVLAGGRAVRLGGIDKAALPVDGRALLDRVLDALPAAAPVVVVGDERPTSRRVRWAREIPAGGGPVPAVRAGLAVLADRADVEVVAVLAADLPFLRRTDVDALAAVAAAHPAGAVLADDDGRAQWLTGVWRRTALTAAFDDDGDGDSMRSRLDRLRPALLHRTGNPPPWWDVDTAAELARARGER